MGTDLGVNPLVGPGDQGIALFQCGIDPAVTPGPVGMLTEKTDSSRDKELHQCSKNSESLLGMRQVHSL